MPFIVYGIKHKSNNELKYIGSTKQNLARRIKEHFNCLKHDIPIYNWIKEVGWNNIEFKILAKVVSHREMRICEINLILLSPRVLNRKKSKGITYNKSVTHR